MTSFTCRFRNQHNVRMHTLYTEGHGSVLSIMLVVILFWMVSFYMVTPAPAEACLRNVAMRRVCGSQHSLDFRLAQVVEGPPARRFAKMDGLVRSRKAARVLQDFRQHVYRSFIGGLGGGAYGEASLILQLLSQTSSREFAFLSATRVAMVTENVRVSRNGSRVYKLQIKRVHEVSNIRGSYRSELSNEDD